jgi:hypothetical protein
MQDRRAILEIVSVWSVLDVRDGAAVVQHESILRRIGAECQAA